MGELVGGVVDELVNGVVRWAVTELVGWELAAVGCVFVLYEA